MRKLILLLSFVVPMLASADPYMNCDEVPQTICSSGVLLYLAHCETKWTFAYGNPVAYPEYRPVVSNNQVVRCN